MRFGVLGAAVINTNAIIKPCFTSPEQATIAALAARDRRRAEAHVKEHKLEGCVVFDGYQDLLDNADVDAIYVPSPNGLHYEWTMKALEASGKGRRCAGLCAEGQEIGEAPIRASCFCNPLACCFSNATPQAGRHVLCEKPFASNSVEARAMVAKAKEKGLVLMEAAHWWYHPFRQRMQDIIASGLPRTGIMFLEDP